MTVPTSIYSVGGLAAVSCKSNVSCLAAGPGDTQLSKGGIVLRLANHHWTSVGLPVAALAEVDLQGVSETSGSSAVVVGYIRDLYGFSTFRLVESKGHRAVKRPRAQRRPGLSAQAFFVSQKILSISAIWSSSFWPTATSVVFLASPAVLVAVQKRSWSSGCFSRCSGLK